MSQLMQTLFPNRFVPMPGRLQPHITIKTERIKDTPAVIKIECSGEALVDKNAKLIVKSLTGKSVYTALDISVDTGICVSAVRNHLARLKDSGLVIMTGTRTQKFWRKA